LIPDARIASTFLSFSGILDFDADTRHGVKLDGDGLGTSTVASKVDYDSDWAQGRKPWEALMHHTCAFFADCTNHEKNINKAAGQDDVLAAFCTQLMYRMKSYVCVYVFCSVHGHVHISKCATYYCTFIRASGQSPISLSLLSIKCPILLNPKNCTPM